MQHGEFNHLVSRTLNRGTTLDERVPEMVRLAAQWLERNYTFTYMERFRLLQVVPGDRTIDFPTNENIKGFKFLRLFGADGRYRYVRKVAPEDLGGLGGVVNSFWVVANRQLVLDSVPTEAMNGEAMWYAYTDWPTEPNEEHPLLRTASDVLLAQTMLFMSIYVLKDTRMAEAYQKMRDEGVNTLTRAEDETRFGGENVAMEYVPIHRL